MKIECKRYSLTHPKRTHTDACKKIVVERGDTKVIGLLRHIMDTLATFCWVSGKLYWASVQAGNA